MLLKFIELNFLQGLIANPCERTGSKCAEFFRRDRNIGTRIGRKYIYSEDDVNRACDLLTALGLPLVSATASYDRADAVNRPGMPEKTGTLAPYGNSIAFHIFNGSAKSQFGYQVAYAKEIDSIKPDLIMVVENLETFRQITRYKWVMSEIESKGETIVLYRGDPVYKIEESKNYLDSTDCEVWGFHDFDPAGLHMSSQIKNLTRHLAPDVDVLRKATVSSNRRDLYFNQITQYHNALDDNCHPQISDLWDLMKTMQRGLPQEWMRDL